MRGWDIDARLLMYADALRRGAELLPGSASNPGPSGPPAAPSHSASPAPGGAAPSGGDTVSGSSCGGDEGSSGGVGGVAKTSGEGVGTASTDSRGGHGTVTQSCGAGSKGDAGAGSSGGEGVDADKGSCTHAADSGAGGSDGVSGRGACEAAGASTGCALAWGAGAPIGMEPLEDSSAAGAGSTGAPADMAPAKRCSCSAAGEGHEPDLLQSRLPAAGTPCPGEAATTAAGKWLEAEAGAARPAPTCGWAAEHGSEAATSGAAALAGRPDRGAPNNGHVAANGIAGPGTAWQTADARHAAAAAAPAARAEPALWGSRWAAGLGLGQRKALERAAVEICAETQRSSALSKGLGSERFTEVSASVPVFGCG